MADIDELSVQLLEQAKRFLEKANSSHAEEEQSAYCNAAILLAFSALEGHINAVSEELTLRSGLSVLDQSILTEKEFSLIGGRFCITKNLKIYRLEDRLTFIFANFTTRGVPSSNPWWNNIKAGLDLRNRLVHPKSGLHIERAAVARTITAILDCLDALYQGLYRRRYPRHNRGLGSSLNF